MQNTSNDTKPARKALQPYVGNPNASVFVEAKLRNGEKVYGTVKRLLTKTDTHPHGIKVELTNGTVCQVTNIIIISLDAS